MLEEVGLGVHGEALDGGVCQAGQADAEFAGLTADFQVGDALDVGALEGVCHAEQGGELANADAVVGAEGGVARVVEPWAGVAVIAGDERDDGDVQPVESENFRVEDQVFRVFVVGPRADVSANLMENGGHLEQQRVMRSELMEIGERLEEAGAEIAYVFAVAGVGLIAFRQDPGGAEDFLGEGAGEFLRDEQVVEQSLLVFAGGDVDLAELEGFGDGEVDFKGGEQGLGGLIVELETLHEFHIAHVGGVGGELAQGLDRANLGGLGKRGSDGLQLVADDHQAVDADIRVVEADLREIPVGVLADDPEHGRTFRVGTLHRLARPVGAHAVAGVARDEAVLKQKRSGVARTHVQDQRGVLAHGGQVEQAAAGFQIDEPGHFPVVDGADPQSAGDADAVHEGLMVGRLAEDVGGHRAGDGVGVEPEFGEGFLIALDDSHDPLGGGRADAAAPENVAGDRRGLFEEIDRDERAVLLALRDHHGDRTRADVQGGE